MASQGFSVVGTLFLVKLWAPAWMSRWVSDRIKGDRISGFFHPKEYPIYR